jgi:hypothetical protein
VGFTGCAGRKSTRKGRQNFLARDENDTGRAMTTTDVEQDGIPDRSNRLNDSGLSLLRAIFESFKIS